MYRNTCGAEQGRLSSRQSEQAGRAGRQGGQGKAEQGREEQSGRGVQMVGRYYLYSIIG
jgi:hypothetical protein